MAARSFGASEKIFPRGYSLWSFVLETGEYSLKEDKLKMGKLNCVNKCKDSSSATGNYPLFLKGCVHLDFICYIAKIEHG